MVDNTRWSLPRVEVFVMTVSKKQQASVNKYVKANYDRINVTFPKGRKAELKAHAAACGESVNGFIVRAVDEAMERDHTPGGNTGEGGSPL